MKFEMNKKVNDTDWESGKIENNSYIVQVFSALVNNQDISKYGDGGKLALNYIKKTAELASREDRRAMADFNAIRRFYLEPLVTEDLKVLSLFGNFQQIGWHDSPEVETWSYSGDVARVQALNGDVVYPALVRKVQKIPTMTISGGFAVDYRAMSLGDFSKERIVLNNIRTDIVNKAISIVVKTIYQAVKNTNSVKNYVECAGLTKAALNDMIQKVRRLGKANVFGTYAFLSQINAFAGYENIKTGNIIAISDKMLDTIQENGILGLYNGAVLCEIPNPYDFSHFNDDGNDYQTLLPEGLGFVLPSGVKSPVTIVTRGGLTSFSGNDITTGQVLTRFDFEFGAAVAEGREFEIGTILDTNLSPTV